MKITLETTQQDDETLQALLDASMVGAGANQPPTLNDFTIALLRTDMDKRNDQEKLNKQNAIAQKIYNAPVAKLTSILTAVNAEIAKP